MELMRRAISNPRLAVDCDLRKIYAVDSAGAVVCSKSPDITPVVQWAQANPSGLVLFEVASALDYTDSKAVAYNKRRWTIWNIAQATRLHASVPHLLVAPSHVWTKGHHVDVRHRVAGALARNKDLRECEAMLWFHQRDPGAWTDYQQFLDGI
jgi:hypothetical protein